MRGGNVARRSSRWSELRRVPKARLDGGGSSTRSPDAAKPPTTATTPPRAREEAAAEALRSLMAQQQLSQTDLLRGLALL